MFQNFLPEDNEKLKIGLLGGSFNPPHKGHLAISLASIKKFNLNRVFWLVTPCSPAKEAQNYLNLSRRKELCQKLVNKNTNLITILDLEKNFSQKKYYSTLTLNRIKKLYPKTNFYWIIGGDNFLTFHLWWHWKKIPNQASLVVCERGKTALQALNSKAAHHLSLIEKYQTDHQKGYFLLHQPRINLSSTTIRQKYVKI
jgi:nicotinate-nucleotide adenylyltransferase